MTGGGGCRGPAARHRRSGTPAAQEARRRPRSIWFHPQGISAPVRTAAHFPGPLRSPRGRRGRVAGRQTPKAMLNHENLDAREGALAGIECLHGLGGLRGSLLRSRPPLFRRLSASKTIVLIIMKSGA